MADDDTAQSESAHDPTEENLGQTINMLVPGWKVFGRYTLESRMGRGAISVVWRAHDELLDESVALKFMAEAVVQDPVAVDDLRQKTARARWLAHPHIVRMNDFMRNNTLAVISMEYIDGETLEQRWLMQPGRVFPAAALEPLIEQLCPALDYAHQAARIVHRGLKPSNVLVTPEGVAKITDFGIANSLAEARVRLMGGMERIRGAMAFMSPQQLDGNPPSPADDIYAFGAMLYQLLTGGPLFVTGDVASQIRTQEPMTMASRRVESGVAGEPIPQAWENAVAACLAKEPAQRPPNGEEIMCLLELSGRRPTWGSRSPVPAVVKAQDLAPLVEQVTPVEEPAAPVPVSAPEAEPAASPAETAPVAEQVLPVEEPAAPVPVSAPKAEPAAGPAETAPVVEQVLPVEEPAAPVPVSTPKAEPAAGPAETVPVVEQVTPVEEPAAPVPVSAPKAEPAAGPAETAPVVEQVLPVEEPAAPVPVSAPKAEPAAGPAETVPVVEQVTPVEEPAAPVPVSTPEAEPAASPAETAPVAEQVLPVEEPAAPVPVSTPKAEPAAGPAETAPAVEMTYPTTEPVIPASPIPSVAPASSETHLTAAVAPKAARPAPPSKPSARPGPPKKRSLIHYPTPEEAEREAEEQKKAPAKLTAPTPLSALAAVAMPTPPVTQASSGSDVTKAVPPQAAHPAPPSKPRERPSPPKKRSLIHYPTPEEAEQEAENEAMAGQSGTGEREKRSWVSRAWTGFFHH